MWAFWKDFKECKSWVLDGGSIEWVALDEKGYIQKVNFNHKWNHLSFGLC